MIIQVGLYRAQRHIDHARHICEMQPDIFAKMEDIMVYTTRELPKDPVIQALMSQRSAAVLDEDLQSVTQSISGPILLAGQAAGLVRTDIPIQDMINFLVEQTYLAAEFPDRSEQAARHRFRAFVAPVLRPQSDPLTSQADGPRRGTRAGTRIRFGCNRRST